MKTDFVASCLLKCIHASVNWNTEERKDDESKINRENSDCELHCDMKQLKKSFIKLFQRALWRTWLLTINYLLPGGICSEITSMNSFQKERYDFVSKEMFDVFEKIINNNNSFEQSEILVDRNRSFKIFGKFGKGYKVPFFFLNNDVSILIIF